MLLDFARNSDLDAKTEVEKVLAFAYYSAKRTKQEHYAAYEANVFGGCPSDPQPAIVRAALLV